MEKFRHLLLGSPVTSTGACVVSYVGLPPLGTLPGWYDNMIGFVLVSISAAPSPSMTSDSFSFRCGIMVMKQPTHNDENLPPFAISVLLLLLVSII
jgi:heme/copper-type cytochrome/quinol oxidase subunit 1